MELYGWGVGLSSGICVIKQQTPHNLMPHPYNSIQPFTVLDWIQVKATIQVGGVLHIQQCMHILNALRSTLS